MGLAYYNEHDPKAAAWLRELIRRGHIAYGYVDDRSILDVSPSDLKHFTQCHFFAGIGGWSYALRLAGWDDTRRVWSGSCPCQPFSAAGKGGGFADERHLWPAWFHLIEECRPSVIFGEQVASKDGLGWLDLVHTDMEGANYAFAATDLCAAGIGAPHIRQRLYFVGLADDYGTGLEIGEADEKRTDSVAAAVARGDSRELGEPDGHPRPSGRSAAASPGLGGAVKSTSGWGNCEWVNCYDGKSRPVEPGTFPLAHGIPHRVGLLRGYGNAIVPQVAATFIESVMHVSTLRSV